MKRIISIFLIFVCSCIFSVSAYASESDILPSDEKQSLHYTIKGNTITA
jgi:hypothetical protein